MAKINKFSNIYDKDGNLVRKVNSETGTLDKYTLKEVEELVDELTKKVQENPENDEYKTQLNNTQSYLFHMYNNMSREDLMERLTVLQNSVEKAKEEINNAEQESLEKANEALDALKEEYVSYEEVA